MSCTIYSINQVFCILCYFVLCFVILLCQVLYIVPWHILLVVFFVYCYLVPYAVLYPLLYVPHLYQRYCTYRYMFIPSCILDLMLRSLFMSCGGPELTDLCSAGFAAGQQPRQPQPSGERRRAELGRPR